MPEALIAGRQAVYFRRFFDIGTLDSNAISDGDMERYAKAYAAPEQLRAAFEFYRAIPANETFNAARRTALEVPLMLVGGDHGFGPLLPDVAEALRTTYGWASIQVEIIENSGHFVGDEQPRVVAELSSATLRDGGSGRDTSGCRVENQVPGAGGAPPRPVRSQSLRPDRRLGSDSAVVTGVVLLRA